MVLDVEDSYSKSVALGPNPKTKPHRLKGPRKFKKGLRVNRDRPAAASEVRYLPPGRMRDYYTQFCAQYGEYQKHASFATFYRVAWQPSGSNLRLAHWASV